MAKQRYRTEVTPVGTFVFPNLNPGNPDEFRNTKKYKTDLKFPQDDEGLKQLEIVCDEVLSKFMQEEGLTPTDWDIKPLTRSAAWTDKETGEVRDEDMVLIHADMKAEYIANGRVQTNVPARVDHNADPLSDSVEINHGDVGRITVAIKPYFWKDKGFVGVRLMLLAVQLVRQNYSASNAAGMFEAVEPEEFVE